MDHGVGLRGSNMLLVGFSEGNNGEDGREEFLRNDVENFPEVKENKSFEMKVIVVLHPQSWSSLSKNNLELKQQYSNTVLEGTSTQGLKLMGIVFQVKSTVINALP